MNVSPNERGIIALNVRTVAALTALTCALLTISPQSSARPDADAIAASPTYTYVEIDVIGIPPGSLGRSQAQDVNNAGQVAGHSTTSGCSHESFVTTDGRSLTNLGRLYEGTCGSTYATAINGSGDVVGYAHVDQYNPPQAFYYSATGTDQTKCRRDAPSARKAVKAAPVPCNPRLRQLDSGLGPGSVGTAYDVNDAGLVVGSRNSSQSGSEHAVIWQNGVVRELPGLGGTPTPYNTLHLAAAVNNSGDVVGSARATNGLLHAARWRNGQIEDIGGQIDPKVQTTAIDVNDLGDVLIQYQSGAAVRTLVWQDGVVREVGAFYPNGMNEGGQIAGYAVKADPSGPSYVRAVVSQAGQLIDLNHAVTNLPAGITLGFASAVNDSGVIVGRSCTNECQLGIYRSYRGFILIPNP